MSYRLGVDVGGTFTDVLLVEEGSGATWRAKTASTPADQAVGVLTGIGKVCADAGSDLAEVAQVLHGTTVATNAILEGKGATVGLVTTTGFRQVLQIARSYVPGGLAGWIASSIMKVRTGLLLNIVLGILGAVVLNAVLLAVFHATWGGIIGQLIVALIGACILIAAFRAVSGRNI